MGFGVLARIGAGVNASSMHAERVDGYTPLAVADTIERKKKILLNGGALALLVFGLVILGLSAMRFRKRVG